MRFLDSTGLPGDTVRSARRDAFRALFESAGDAMLLADDDRRYVDANPAACALLELERSDVVGRTIDEFTPATRAQLADGWASFSGTAAAGNVALDAVANVPPGLHLSILRDVTDRERAEEERRLFVAIVSSMRAGLRVWQFDNPDDDPGDMRLVYANPATMTASGVAPDTIIGHTLRTIFPSLAETDIPAVYAEVALGGEARSLGDVVYDDRDDDTVFAARLYPVANRRVAVSFSDVTSERRSNAVALSSLNSMSDAMMVLDREWRYTFLNDASVVFGEVPREELLGRNIWEVYPALVGSQLFVEYHRAIRDDVAVMFDAYFDRLDKWCSIRAFPSASGLAIYYQEISARKELEAQLLQSQKLEAVGRLAGGLAHDFNNLLTVIIGYASLAEAQRTTDPEFVGKALEEIRGASESATALTAKLLAFSRKQMLQATVADMNQLVGGALAFVRPLIGDNIAVHPLLRPSCGNTVVEVAQIERVVINLVINARDALPNGGNIYVETGAVDLDGESVPALGPGRYLVLTIRDDGEGMDENTLAQIFDPFFTTKPLGQGTGLGLSMAYGAVGQSGGHIEAASELGEGTTFTIYLPQTEEPVTPTSRPHRPVTVSGGEHVLVVEDDDVVRGLVVNILESYGYDVTQACNQQEALDHIAESQFDLMITAVVLSGGSGPDVVRHAKTTQPALRVLYISGFRPEELSESALDSSTGSFLQKPFSAADLAERIRDLLDRRPLGQPPA